MSFQAEVPASDVDSEEPREGLSSHQDSLLGMHSSPSSVQPSSAVSVPGAAPPGLLSHLDVVPTSSLISTTETVAAVAAVPVVSTPMAVAGGRALADRTGTATDTAVMVASGTETDVPSSLHGALVLPSLPHAPTSKDGPSSPTTDMSQQQQQQQRRIVPSGSSLPPLPPLPLSVAMAAPPFTGTFLTTTMSSSPAPSPIMANIGRYALHSAGPLPSPSSHLSMPLSASTVSASTTSQASSIVGSEPDDSTSSLHAPAHQLYYTNVPHNIPPPPILASIRSNGGDVSNASGEDGGAASAPMPSLTMDSLPSAENFRLQPGASGTSGLGSSAEEQATVAAMELVSSVPEQQDEQQQQQNNGSDGRTEDIEQPDTPSFVPEVQMKGNKPWTPEEDERLKVAVQMHSLRHWKKIARHVPGRTAVQCLQHYKHVLHPGIERGSWTQEEDNEVLRLIAIHGMKWATIAEQMPRRLGKRIRERYVNHLDPSLKQTAWTTEEEVILIQKYQVLGQKWAKIAKFLPGRSVNSVKNHWSAVSRGRGVLNIGARGQGCANAESNGGAVGSNSNGVYGDGSSSGGASLHDAVVHSGLGAGGLTGNISWSAVDDGGGGSFIVSGSSGEDNVSGGAASIGTSGETHGTGGHGAGVGEDGMDEQGSLVQDHKAQIARVEIFGDNGDQEESAAAGTGGSGEQPQELGLSEMVAPGVSIASTTAAPSTTTPGTDAHLVASPVSGAGTEEGSGSDLARPSVATSSQGQHRHHHHPLLQEQGRPQGQQQHQPSQGHMDSGSHSIVHAADFSPHPHHHHHHHHHHHPEMESLAIPVSEEAMFSASTGDLIPPSLVTTVPTVLQLGMDAVGGGTNGISLESGEHQQYVGSGASKSSVAAAQRWTDEQSLRLRKLVEETGAKDWTNISKKIPSKTYLQCMLHWNHVINPELTKGKGSWKPEEDKRIVELVQQFGPKWSVIAAKLKVETGRQSRVGKQIRERYLHHLDPNLKKGPWTREEELILIREHQIHNNKWAQIAKALPGRCDNDIKNHWYAQQRRNPEMSRAFAAQFHHGSMPEQLSAESTLGGDATGTTDGTEDEDDRRVMASDSVALHAHHLPPAKRARTDHDCERHSKVGVGNGHGGFAAAAAAATAHLHGAGGHVSGIENSGGHFGTGVGEGGHEEVNNINHHFGGRHNDGNNVIENDYPYDGCSAGNGVEGIYSGDPGEGTHGSHKASEGRGGENGRNDGSDRNHFDESGVLAGSISSNGGNHLDCGDSDIGGGNIKGAGTSDRHHDGQTERGGGDGYCGDNVIHSQLGRDGGNVNHMSAAGVDDRRMIGSNGVGRNDQRTAGCDGKRDASPRDDVRNPARCHEEFCHDDVKDGGSQNRIGEEDSAKVRDANGGLMGDGSLSDGTESDDCGDPANHGHFDSDYCSDIRGGSSVGMVQGSGIRLTAAAARQQQQQQQQQQQEEEGEEMDVSEDIPR